jgi:ATP-dependent DNA helicase RecG
MKTAFKTGNELEQANSKATEEFGTKLALGRHQVNILHKCCAESGIGELMKVAGRSDRTKFRNKILRPLLEEKLIEMTIPDKPSSSNQKYKTTPKGIALKNKLFDDNDER